MTTSGSGSRRPSSLRSGSASGAGGGTGWRLSNRSRRRSLRLARKVMLRVARSFVRSLLLPLLLTVATWSLLPGGGAETAQASPPEQPEPVTVPPSFDTWEPCTSSEGLTVTEWSACQSAYNVDEIRSLLAIALVLIVGLLVAIWLALVTA